MISLVVAIDEDGIIGDSETDGLPWHCAVDLELFRRLTWGADVVVGRKTWEELPESVRECEGRRWMVATFSLGNVEGAHRYGEIDIKGLYYHTYPCHIVIAGGASIYKQALDAGIVDRCFLTRLPIHSGSDVEWPGLGDGWEKVRGTELYGVSVWREDGDGHRHQMNSQPKSNPTPTRLEEWAPGNNGGSDE